MSINVTSRACMLKRFLYQSGCFDSETDELFVLGYSRVARDRTRVRVIYSYDLPETDEPNL